MRKPWGSYLKGQCTSGKWLVRLVRSPTRRLIAMMLLWVITMAVAHLLGTLPLQVGKPKLGKLA